MGNIIVYMEFGYNLPANKKELQLMKKLGLANNITNYGAFKL